MSARMTGLVFERYEGGGGEMLLALALADHAHDDGTHIYLRVETLAGKTRQSVRTVQYQLRKMQGAGWLMVDGVADGGRGKAVKYRINPAWIKGEMTLVKGANIAPFVEAGGCEKGANSAPFNGTNGAKAIAPLQPDAQPERVQSDARKGATAIAPAIEPSEPNTVIHPHTPKGANQAASEGRGQRSLMTFKAWLADCRARGEKPIGPNDPVYALAQAIGLPGEYLALHWAEFKRTRLTQAKRQRDWRATFRNSVRGNWFKLWYLDAQERCELTTVGKQAMLLQQSADQQGGGDNAA